MQIYPYLFPYIKLKSKWSKDLNINPITLNLKDEKVVSSLECLGTDGHFLNIAPVAQTLRAAINKWEMSVKQRTQSIRQDSNLQNRKRFSPTPHQTED